MMIKQLKKAKLSYKYRRHDIYYFINCMGHFYYASSSLNILVPIVTAWKSGYYIIQNSTWAHSKYMPLNTFLQNWKKLPYIYTNCCSFQLKWTLEAVKLWYLLFLLTQSRPIICRSTVSNNKALFLHNYLRNIMLWIQNNFNMLRTDLKTDTFLIQRYDR